MSDNAVNKKERIIARVENEIGKLANNFSNVYFFVFDSKGNPNESLEYIYRLAKAAKDSDYKVTILYQEAPVAKKDDKGNVVMDADNKPEMEDPFVGVQSWLGEEFSSLPHINTAMQNVDLAPSDVVFVPEMYASVMQKMKSFPCKRVAIVTNYEWLIESLPIGEQWGNYGVVDAIAPSKILADQIKSIFPYVNVSVVNPYVDEKYTNTEDKLKSLVINVVAQNQDDIAKVINPFYWRYPMFKWVVFRELRGIPQEAMAKRLKDGAITLFLNDDSTFCMGALKAMKAGSIVVGKLPNMLNDWLYNEDAKQFNNCGYWFDDMKAASTVLANVIKMWTLEQIPQETFDAQNIAVSQYSEEITKSQLSEYISGVFSKRLEELNKTLEDIKKEN